MDGCHQRLWSFGQQKWWWNQYRSEEWIIKKKFQANVKAINTLQHDLSLKELNKMGSSEMQKNYGKR